jgi:hypothetical protein
MKYLYLFSNWTLGIFALVAATTLLVIYKSPLGGISFVLISLFLLPPVRDIVFAKTNLALTARMRSSIIFVLFLLAGFFWWQTMQVMIDDYNVEQTAIASAEAAAIREENKRYFDENSEEIIRELEANMSAGNFTKVARVSRRYLVSGDAQLAALHDEANSRLAERAEAQKAEREALAKAQEAERETLARAEKAEREALAKQKAEAASLREKSVAEEIQVGALIDRVIAGEDFAGKKLIISGVALITTTTNERLVNLGTRKTHNSGAFENFVSVYDTDVLITQGKDVSVQVLIETSSAAKLGDRSFVMIESAFIGCVDC